MRRRWKVSEYAAMNEVSPQTVYAMVAANKLAHIRLGVGRGTIRILDDEVGPERGDEDGRPVTPTKPTKVKKPKVAKLKHLRPPS